MSPPCPPKGVALVSLRAKDQAGALAEVKGVFPEATPDSVCIQVDGDNYFLRTDKVAIASPNVANHDGSFQLNVHRATVSSFTIELKGKREKLADAYETRERLKQGAGHRSNFVQKVLAGTGGAVLGFGLVTKAFEDTGTRLSTSRVIKGGQVGYFQRLKAIRRIMKRDNLCEPTYQLSREAAIRSMLAGGAVLGAGAALYYGAGLAERYFHGKVLEATPNPVSSRTSSPDSGDKKVAVMTQSELDAAMQNVTGQMAEVEEEFSRVNKEIVLLKMGQMSKESLGAVSEPELRRQAEELVRQNQVASEPSFLDRLGIPEYLGIGLGFGWGVGTFAETLKAVVPWSNSLETGSEIASEMTMIDAEHEVENLKRDGILKECKSGESPLNGVAGKPAIISGRRYLKEASDASLGAYKPIVTQKQYEAAKKELKREPNVFEEADPRFWSRREEMKRQVGEYGQLYEQLADDVSRKAESNVAELKATYKDKRSPYETYQAVVGWGVLGLATAVGLATSIEAAPLILGGGTTMGAAEGGTAVVGEVAAGSTSVTVGSLPFIRIALTSAANDNAIPWITRAAAGFGGAYFATRK